MSKQIKITHYYHSGFSVEFEDLLFIFDYWTGEHQDIPQNRQITSEFLRGFRQVYVLISHEHPDHLDPVVFSWKAPTPIQYIISFDMPAGIRGQRMAPGDEFSPEEGITLKTFDSTDLGVSFLLDLKGTTVFHAGDLNFWHWRNESTPNEISEAEIDFQKAVRPLEKERIDIAFFPVDPRQGSMFEAGANYFILCVKPRLMIPMHYFHRTEIIMDYARTAGNRVTEVLAMPGIGDSIIVNLDNANYMDISFPNNNDVVAIENEKSKEDTIDQIGEDNPFSDTDLPLSQLAKYEK